MPNSECTGEAYMFPKLCVQTVLSCGEDFTRLKCAVVHGETRHQTTILNFCQRRPPRRRDALPETVLPLPHIRSAGALLENIEIPWDAVFSFGELKLT